MVRGPFKRGTRRLGVVTTRTPSTIPIHLWLSDRGYYKQANRTGWIQAVGPASAPPLCTTHSPISSRDLSPQDGVNKYTGRPKVRKTSDSPASMKEIVVEERAGAPSQGVKYRLVLPGVRFVPPVPIAETKLPERLADG